MIKFGTDGIRAVVGRKFSEKECFRCGTAFKNKVILIGRDTRASGERLKNAFICGVESVGGKVLDIGVCSTPGVAYLTIKNNCDFGVVISASHNGYKYNGIKIFNSIGEKISSTQERRIEKFLNRTDVSAFVCKNRATKLDLLPYINFLCGDMRKINKTVVLDCANGAVSEIAPKVFSSVGCKVYSMSHTPNGRNINLRCGATCITRLRKTVVNLQADLGFAFDGDGDRVIAVDKTGNVFDGDKIIYILAKNTLKKGEKVVGTIYSNEALSLALKKLGIKFFRANVGDKNVRKVMKTKQCVLGGEPAGHIILNKYLPTGDGLLTSIILTKICAINKARLSDFVDYKPFYQAKANLFYNEDFDLAKVKLCVSKIKRGLAGKVRIVVRKSGTEPCVRVLVESASKTLAQKTLENIKQNLTI